MEKVVINGRSYETIRIGNKIWMNENLRDASHLEGRGWTDGINYYYEKEAAMSLELPDGWHLPDMQEWEMLKESGEDWNMELNGYYSPYMGGFNDTGKNGRWWIKDCDDCIYFFAKDKDNQIMNRCDSKLGLSVRCVRDLSEEEKCMLNDTNSLENICDGELINELRRRGYHGEIKKEIHF